MLEHKTLRRDFLKAALAGIPLAALDWNSFPRGGRRPGLAGPSARAAADTWDAIIVGAGLGGLS
jgi:hypothetical protein